MVQSKIYYNIKSDKRIFNEEEYLLYINLLKVLFFFDAVDARLLMTVVSEFEPILV